jgi:hypothetical protein
MDLTEGVGESSSPPRSFGSVSNYDVRSDVYNRFIESGHEEAVSNPELFRELLDSHFNRLPARFFFFWILFTSYLIFCIFILICDRVWIFNLFLQLNFCLFGTVIFSYGLDVNMDRIEDVLLHRKLLAMAKDPARRPVYHIRFLEVLPCSSSSFG